MSVHPIFDPILESFKPLARIMNGGTVIPGNDEPDSDWLRDSQNIPTIMDKCGAGMSLTLFHISAMHEDGDPVEPECCKLCRHTECGCIELIEYEVIP